MSALVQVVCRDRQYKLTRKRAERKVSSGLFKWVGRFSIVELEGLPVAAITLAQRPFRYGPVAGFHDWRPRMSASFLVMQLRTSGGPTP